MLDKARIQILSKWPVPGRVKTRLAVDLSAALVAQMQRALLQYVCSEALKVDAETELWLDALPDEPVAMGCRHVYVQQGFDLGARMAYTARTALDQGYASLILGSDCPAINESYLQNAYVALAGQEDIVLGPTEDGGYALLGSKRFVPDIFENMLWSTSQVAAVTIERLQQANIGYQLLAKVRDIDELPDLQDFLQQTQACNILGEALYHKLLTAATS